MGDFQLYRDHRAIQCGRMADFYDENAESFVAQTRDVDMAELRGRFMAALPGRLDGPARILDAGSGSGRDALAFRRAGYDVSAFDASQAMVEATRAHAGVPARWMRFEDFVWDHPFEGIWACASLLHVADADLAGVLDRLVAHLVRGGVLYLSFKRGEGERIKDGRRFTDMTEARLAALLDRCTGMDPPEIWASGDRRVGRDAEIWINALVRRT
jgi:SAM-dependent methyltransferase